MREIVTRSTLVKDAVITTVRNEGVLVPPPLSLDREKPRPESLAEKLGVHESVISEAVVDLIGDTDERVSMGKNFVFVVSPNYEERRRRFNGNSTHTSVNEIVQSAIIKSIAEGANPDALMKEWKVENVTKKNAVDRLRSDGVIDVQNGTYYLNRGVTKVIQARRKRGV